MDFSISKSNMKSSCHFRIEVLRFFQYFIRAEYRRTLFRTNDVHFIEIKLAVKSFALIEYAY